MRYLIVALTFLTTTVAFGQDCHSEVNARGDHAMGFSHLKTTHHFLLEKDGGIIDITAKDESDKESIDSIRGHLQHIRSEFEKGNYALPMFIHDRVPPGVDVMKERKDKIKFRYEEQKNGGRVVMQTDDGKTLEAIHAFLKFQIADHQTGDSTNAH